MVVQALNGLRLVPFASALPVLDAGNYEASLRGALSTPRSWMALQLVDAVNRLEDMAMVAQRPTSPPPVGAVHGAPTVSAPVRERPYENAVFNTAQSPKGPMDLLHAQLSTFLGSVIPEFAPINNTVVQLFGPPPNRVGLTQFRDQGLKPVFLNPPKFDAQA